MRCIHYLDVDDPLLVQKAWDTHYAAIALQKGVPNDLQLPVEQPDRTTARWAKPKHYAQPPWTSSMLSREQRIKAIREHRKEIPDEQQLYRRLHRWKPQA